MTNIDCKYNDNIDVSICIRVSGDSYAGDNFHSSEMERIKKMLETHIFEMLRRDLGLGIRDIKIS